MTQVSLTESRTLVGGPQMISDLYSVKNLGFQGKLRLKFQFHQDF